MDLTIFFLQSRNNGYVPLFKQIPLFLGSLLAKVPLEMIKKGMDQGIKEAKLEGAKKMLAEGLELSLIARVTGLSREEIEKLK